MKNACLWAALAVAATGCSTTVTTGCIDDRDCLSGEFCDADGFCVALGCIDDTDCLAGEFCDVDGFCVADNTYSACTTTANCSDPVDECFEVDLPAEATIGNFCSNVCAADAECDAVPPWSGVCYAIEADPTFLCYQQCEFDSDCFAGSVCVEVSLDPTLVDFICVPDN